MFSSEASLQSASIVSCSSGAASLQKRMNFSYFLCLFLESGPLRKSPVKSKCAKRRLRLEICAAAEKWSTSYENEEA